MKSNLIISQKLYEKFLSTDFTLSVWQNLNISNIEELFSYLILKINNYNSKLNLLSIIVGDTNDRRNMHTAFIVDEVNNFEIAYVFFISPGSIARNMFLSQQAYSGIHNIFKKYCVASICNDIYNKPVYIINTNENDLQDSKIATIKGALNMGLHYIDIINNNSFIPYNILEEYNQELIRISSNSNNNWFSINETTKTVTFHTGKNRLKDGTSDRYEFLSRQFPALKLSYLGGYKSDISEIENNENRETVDSFINYFKKIYNS